MDRSVFHASASAWQVHNTTCTNNMIFNLNLLIELIFIIVYCSVCQTTPQIYTLSTHNSGCDLGSEFLHSKSFLTKNSRICSRHVQFMNGNVWWSKLYQYLGSYQIINKLNPKVSKMHRTWTFEWYSHRIPIQILGLFYQYEDTLYIIAYNYSA